MLYHKQLEYASSFTEFIWNDLIKSYNFWLVHFSLDSKLELSA